MVLYGGFLVGTFLCAISPTYQTLVAARIATGIFGGILGGMAITISGDVFPEQRRGAATGALMTGFAVASVVGVPLGLYLGNNFGWNVPFLVLAIGGFPLLIIARFALPPLNDHVLGVHAHPLRSLLENFVIPNHVKAFVVLIALMIGSFTVFPYASAYLVSNVGMTKYELPLIYVVGGALTLVASPIIGRLSDKYGKLTIYRIFAPASAALLLTLTNLPRVYVFVAIAVFASLMVCNVGRMIAVTALITGSVEPRRRGGFMSAYTAIQHVACGVAASLGGAIISKESDGPMEHFGTVGLIAAGSTLLTVWLAGRLRPYGQSTSVSAEAISLAAAAEASVDAGEPIELVVEQI
jgi:predicted MFS family arabinose efflux permease